MKIRIGAYIFLVSLTGCNKQPSPATMAAQPIRGKSVINSSSKYEAEAEAERRRFADLPKIQPKTRMKFMTPSIHRIQLSDDGKRFALDITDSDHSRRTNVWTTEAKPKLLLKSETGYGGGVFALSPSGKRLLVSGIWNSVYDVDTGKTFGNFKNADFTHAFFLNDELVAMTSRSYDFTQKTRGSIRIHNITNNTEEGKIELPDNLFQEAFPVRGKEFWLFATEKQFHIDCYDLIEKKLIRTITPLSKEGAPLYLPTYLGVAQDGSIVTFNSVGFDWNSYKYIEGFKNNLENSHIPGSRLVTYSGGYNDNKYVTLELILWNLKTQAPEAVFTAFSKDQIDPKVGVSADGKTLAVATTEFYDSARTRFTDPRPCEVLIFDIPASPR